MWIVPRSGGILHQDFAFHPPREKEYRMAETLDMPPFPTLTWDDFFWEGKDLFPGWEGFQERGGAYTSVSGKGPSRGEAKIFVATPGQKPTPPAAEQAAAYRRLKAEGPAIAGAVLAAVFERYPELQESYAYEGDEKEEYMPDVSAPDGLKRLMGLGTVHLLSAGKDGEAYVGFELGCTWDEEHGTGVLTHKGKVVDVGGADTAFSNP
jgi:hypothetical protein